MKRFYIFYIIFELFYIYNESKRYSSTLFTSLNTDTIQTTPTTTTTTNNNNNNNNTSKSLLIGAPISYSPNDKYFSKGKLIINSWELFIDWVNIERGGIRYNNENISISIKIIDDYSNIDDVKYLTRYFLNNEKVDFMFSPYTSDLTNASAFITEESNFLLFSAIAHPWYTTLNSTLFTLPTDISRMKSGFHSFASFGAKNISIITENDHDNCLYENALLAAQSEGITLFSHHTLNTKSTTYQQDLTDILLMLKENNVDVVVGCSISSLCTYIPTISRNIDYNARAMGFISCFSDPAIQSSMGELVNYLYDITPWGPLDSIKCNITGWTAKEFEERYYKYFNLRPSYHAASAFADCLILLSAIESTQSLDHQVLLKAIKTQTFQTMYATLSFYNGPQATFNSLVEQMTYNYNDGTYNLIVVSPETVAQGNAIYPMPTWKAKKCMADTLYCNGHGTCSNDGICICDNNYYGKYDINSCDGYCSGEMKSGICFEIQYYYIGGLVPFDLPVSNEFISMMYLAVELINNKTDGWYDEELKQVMFILQVNNSDCDSSIVYNAVLGQNNWALNKNNKNLDGVIGDLCSDASKSVASYGKSISLPQISYASTASSLSNVDLYPYFSRTCSSDEMQSESLVSLLEYIGLTPFIVVLYRTDLEYSTSLASDFITKWISKGYILLLEYGIDSKFNSYNDLILKIASTGVQSILLALEFPEIQQLWNASNNLQLLNEDIVWIAVESWSSITFQNTDIKKNGVIGLSFYESNEKVAQNFIKLWEKLDPTKYFDANGDRSNIEIYSSYIIDSFIALALAYQEAINQRTNLENELFRQYVFDILCDSVAFNGISGHKEFSVYGNQIDNKFTIRSYYYFPSSNTIDIDNNNNNNNNEFLSSILSTSTSSMISEWVNIGYLNETIISMNMNDLVWPDGSTGINKKYSNQLPPYCSPGMEPIPINGVYYCQQCSVGYYKSTYGSNPCQSCPIGGNCNNIGVIIPCILPGYWRMNPPNDELADFNKYKIYQCDNQESCLGGCQLNTSCAYDRDQSSPTCGVCLEKYYLSNGYCTKCSESKSYIPILIYFFECFGICLGLFYVINVRIKYDENELINEANQVESQNEILNENIQQNQFNNNDNKNNNNNNNVQILKTQTESFVIQSPLNELQIIHSEKNNNINNNNFEDEIRETNKTSIYSLNEENESRSRSMSSHLRTVSESITTSQFFRFTVIAVTNTYLLFRSFLPRTSVTFKLIISFWQVMTSGFFSLQISWPSNMKRFFNSMLSINPFDVIFESSSCSKHEILTSYLILVIIFCLPFIFFCCLMLSVYFVYKFKVEKYSNLLLEQYNNLEKGTMLSQLWIKKCNKIIWGTSTTILVWFALIIFAVGSATMLEFLNCRDLGTAGVFLRSDYSIDCESQHYKSYKILAIFGLLLYPIGIPVTFYYLIRYRSHPYVTDCSIMLYANFNKSWKYFEVYDLIRKLLLTSILLYISTPDSPSRCLYLLIIDLISLNIISYCQPYLLFYDNFLATVFIIIELIAFFIGLVITSEIYKSENYNYSAMFTTLIVLIIITVLFITPVTFLLKLKLIQEEYMEYILNHTVRKSTGMFSFRPSFLTPPSPITSSSPKKISKKYKINNNNNNNSENENENDLKLQIQNEIQNKTQKGNNDNMGNNEENNSGTNEGFIPSIRLSKRWRLSSNFNDINDVKSEIIKPEIEMKSDQIN